MLVTLCSALLPFWYIMEMNPCVRYKTGIVFPPYSCLLDDITSTHLSELTDVKSHWFCTLKNFHTFTSITPCFNVTTVCHMRVALLTGISSLPTESFNLCEQSCQSQSSRKGWTLILMLLTFDSIWKYFQQSQHNLTIARLFREWSTGHPS